MALIHHIIPWRVILVVVVFLRPCDGVRDPELILRGIAGRDVAEWNNPLALLPVWMEEGIWGERRDLRFCFWGPCMKKDWFTRDWKVSGFWLPIIHFLSFLGKQSGINIISSLPFQPRNRHFHWNWILVRGRERLKTGGLVPISFSEGLSEKVNDAWRPLSTGFLTLGCLGFLPFSRLVLQLCQVCVFLPSFGLSHQSRFLLP